jgi:D-serine dehydratase
VNSIGSSPGRIIFCLALSFIESKYTSIREENHLPLILQIVTFGIVEEMWIYDPDMGIYIYIYIHTYSKLFYLIKLKDFL